MTYRQYVRRAFPVFCCFTGAVTAENWPNPLNQQIAYVLAAIGVAACAAVVAGVVCVIAAGLAGIRIDLDDAP